MSIEEFMVVFHGAVKAVENGEVAEIDLHSDPGEDSEGSLEVMVTIRRNPFPARREEPE